MGLDWLVGNLLHGTKPRKFAGIAAEVALSVAQEAGEEFFAGDDGAYLLTSGEAVVGFLRRKGEKTGNIERLFQSLEEQRIHDVHLKKAGSKISEQSAADVTNMLQGFANGRYEPYFGVNFFKAFAKGNSKLTADELQRYALVWDVSRYDDHGNIFWFKKFDSKFNVCLNYDGQLAASIGFNPEEGGIIIGQIQGVKGMTQITQFYWQKALMEYVIDLAKKHGIPQVRVLSVDNNWYAHETFESFKQAGLYPRHFSFEDAKRIDVKTESEILKKAHKLGVDVFLTPRQGFYIYDMNAINLNFERMGDRNYAKVLN